MYVLLKYLKVQMLPYNDINIQIMYNFKGQGTIQAGEPAGTSPSSMQKHSWFLSVLIK